MSETRCNIVAQWLRKASPSGDLDGSLMRHSLDVVAPDGEAAESNRDAEDEGIRQP